MARLKSGLKTILVAGVLLWFLGCASWVPCTKCLNIGDSVITVVEKCGDPNDVQTIRDADGTYTQWTYYYQDALIGMHPEIDSCSIFMKDGKVIQLRN